MTCPFRSHPRGARASRPTRSCAPRAGRPTWRDTRRLGSRADRAAAHPSLDPEGAEDRLRVRRRGLRATCRPGQFAAVGSLDCCALTTPPDWRAHDERCDEATFSADLPDARPPQIIPRHRGKLRERHVRRNTVEQRRLTDSSSTSVEQRTLQENVEARRKKDDAATPARRNHARMVLRTNPNRPCATRPGASYPNGYILWHSSPYAGWGMPARPSARFP